MQAYLKFANKAFLKESIYKFNYMMGILNTVMMMIVYVTIWKTIYGSNKVIEGVDLKVVVTNFVLCLAISQAFAMNDFMVSERISDGSIVFDILRPISLMGYLLASNIGSIAFKVIMQVIPAIVVAAFVFGILPPASLLDFSASIISLMLGFLIMFLISFIISSIAFWFHNVWSISTIKNVFIYVLSGVYIPLWYLPEGLQQVIRYTPFDSIYYTPVSIYLGRFGKNEIIMMMAKQAFWILLFYGAAKWIHSTAIKKLVVQGG